MPCKAAAHPKTRNPTDLGSNLSSFVPYLATSLTRQERQYYIPTLFFCDFLFLLLLLSLSLSVPLFLALLPFPGKVDNRYGVLSFATLEPGQVTDPSPRIHGFFLVTKRTLSLLNFVSFSHKFLRLSFPLKSVKFEPFCWIPIAFLSGFDLT